MREAAIFPIWLKVASDCLHNDHPHCNMHTHCNIRAHCNTVRTVTSVRTATDW